MRDVWFYRTPRSPPNGKQQGADVKTDDKLAVHKTVFFFYLIGNLKRSPWVIPPLTLIEYIDYIY